MSYLKHIFLTAASFSCVGVLLAQGPDEGDPMARAKYAGKVAKQDAANRDTYKGNPDVLVLPGLVANRLTKRVEVTVESTGLNGGEACEYLVIGAEGDHGYESLLWAHAKPSDIHKALEFIGMEAGAPFNPGELRFWAKGERVIASVIQAGSDLPVRIESLVVSGEERKAIPQDGFVFCGSLVIPDHKDKTVRRYLADQLPSRSILPAYNEPASVFDVTYQASKGEVYQSHVVNPETMMPANRLATLRLEPEYKDGKRRIAELSLTIGQGGFRLVDRVGKELNQEPGLDAVLESCYELMKDGRTPYISLTFDNDLELSRISPLAQMFARIDTAAAVRIEPPGKDQLYYRSFLPNPMWRNVNQRISQPWELHFKRANGKIAVTMVYHEFTWQGGALEPDISKQRYPAVDASAIRQRLDDQAEALRKKGERLPPDALIVFAPADMTYGELIDFVGPLQTTHKAIHLFLE